MGGLDSDFVRSLGEQEVEGIVDTANDLPKDIQSAESPEYYKKLYQQEKKKTEKLTAYLQKVVPELRKLKKQGNVGVANCLAFIDRANRASKGNLKK